MLLMVKKDVKGGICHAIHRQAKANNKYNNDYTENRKSLHLKYWDINIMNGKYNKVTCKRLLVRLKSI